MSVDQLLQALNAGVSVQFADVLAAIAAHYDYQPCAFRNGAVNNAAGQNEGSCKVLAFARLHGLSVAQTLALFGEHYQAVLADPSGSQHANIRAFQQQGWAGVEFEGEPLSLRVAVMDR